MPVKSITVDLEAYDLLAAAKREGESFSKVIKRRFGPRRTAPKRRSRPGCTARELLEHLNEIAFEEETLDRIDEVIASRKQFLTASEPLDAEE